MACRAGEEVAVARASTWSIFKAGHPIRKSASKDSYGWGSRGTQSVSWALVPSMHKPLRATALTLAHTRENKKWACLANDAEVRGIGQNLTADSFRWFHVVERRPWCFHVHREGNHLRLQYYHRHRFKQFLQKQCFYLRYEIMQLIMVCFLMLLHSQCGFR